MQPCRYVEYTKCESCNVVNYKKCNLFLKAHISFLARNIMPFKFKPVDQCKDRVVVSRDVNVAKSYITEKAVALNIPVHKYNLNQVLSLTMSSEEVSDRVVFIELNSKFIGDVEKIKSVICSFVDKVSMSGYVSIYIGSAVSLQFQDYHKI